MPAARRIDLDALPRHSYPAGTTLWRIHRTDQPCWYFSADGKGRFDPVRHPDHGACYLGEEDLAAWIEVYRTRKDLAQADLDNRRLAIVRLNVPVEVIDLTGRRALAAGVTNAPLHSNRYETAQALASRASQAGVAGIRWYAKHDPASRLRAVALFGPEGDNSWKGLGLPRPTRSPIPRELITQACEEFGYRILPIP